MHLLFSRRSTFASAAIRAVTWSRWSHVAVVFGTEAWESRAATGVQRIDYVDAVAGLRNADVCYVRCNDIKARAFLMQQWGKPYDWTAPLGIFLHRDWQEPDSWFCSELAAAAALAGGTVIVNKPGNRITPEDLYNSPVVERS